MVKLRRKDARVFTQESLVGISCTRNCHEKFGVPTRNISHIPNPTITNIYLCRNPEAPVIGGDKPPGLLEELLFKRFDGNHMRECFTLRKS